MLTIGELASAAGVSTRTVRWYHARGLLAEPERDASGFRRYGADDVVRLSRIVALAAAGVPLRRIAELLGADDATFAAELARIDADVRAEVRRLRAVRETLSALQSADRLALPPVLADTIAHLRRAGVAGTYVDQFRDGAILLHALYPAQLAQWLEEGGLFTDPAYLDLVTRTFLLADVDPDDPRVAALAAESVEFVVTHPQTTNSTARFEDPRANALIDARRSDTPAWRRVSELTVAGMRERGLPVD